MPRKRKPVGPVGNLGDPHGMAVMMEKFIDSLHVSNFSKQTIRDRKWHLSRFIAWAEQRGVVRPNEVTRPILQRYQRHLYHYRKENGQPLSFSSQHSRLSPLRSWFKWLARNNFILYNPASELELPRLEQRLPKHVLTISEAESVMRQPDIGQPLGVRDRAILEVLYSTGIRRMEVIGLKLYDIDSERGTMMIRLGKGKKDRMVPVGRRALNWIDKYTSEVRPSLVIDPNDTTLFLTQMGLPFKPTNMTEKVRQYIDAAEIGKSGSCHLFRHTMATLMLENGADIRFIQAMLGHANLETTQIYTRVTIRKLKEIHDATHPAKSKRDNDSPDDPSDERPSENPEPPKPR